MTFVVFLCMWIDGRCEPFRIVGYGANAHEQCLTYTYASPFKDGCYTYLVELENV